MTAIRIELSPGCIWPAQRNGFPVYSEQDYVCIEHADGRLWNIGWTYENEVAALITRDERYTVIVWHGVIICDLGCPGQAVNDGATWEETPGAHLMAAQRYSRDSILIEQVSQDERIEIRLTTDLMDQHVGSGNLNPQTFEFRPVPHCEPIS